MAGWTYLVKRYMGIIMFMIHQYYNNDFEQFNEVYTDAQVTVNVYNSV